MTKITYAAYNDFMDENEKARLRDLLEGGDPDAWSIVGAAIGARRRKGTPNPASAANGKKGGRPVGSKDSRPRTRTGTAKVQEQES